MEAEKMEARSLFGFGYGVWTTIFDPLKEIRFHFLELLYKESIICLKD